MVELFTHELILSFKELFNLFDKDGDGSITSQELGALMRSLGEDKTEDELNAMTNAMDIDSIRHIDFAQFLTVMARTLKPTLNSYEEILEAFRVLDKDQKGFITAMDLWDFLISLWEKLTEEEVDKIVERADVNDYNRKVDYEEFKKMMTGRANGGQVDTPTCTIPLRQTETSLGDNIFEADCVFLTRRELHWLEGLPNGELPS